jgi:hypothetical protein
VPLYIYPARGAWQPLIDAKQANKEVPVFAIVNPGSGPGSRTDANYVAGISALKAVGIVTIAYVATSYGRRACGDVVKDIDAYSRLYGRTFDGLFMDEMAKTDSRYYGTVSSYAKENGFARVIGNPGTEVPEEYVGRASDTLVIYENEGVPSPGFLGGWHTAYAKETWAFISHHVPVLDASFVTFAKDRVGLLYMTDSNYHAFPQYLTRLFELL